MDTSLPVVTDLLDAWRTLSFLGTFGAAVVGGLLFVSGRGVWR